MPCPTSIDALCEKIVTNVSCGVGSVICPVILAKYCHVTEMTENYDWHYRGYLEPLGTSRPNHLCQLSLPPSGPVSHHNSSPSDVTNVETRSLCPLSSKSKIQYKLTRLRQCNGTDVILTHSKLTHDWHEYLFSYKRCKSFPQLNCDADKSCHNKQYLWLRRLWAIVAVTEKIKLLNEWVDAEVSF